MSDKADSLAKSRGNTGNGLRIARADPPLSSMDQWRSVYCVSSGLWIVTEADGSMHPFSTEAAYQAIQADESGLKLAA